MEQNDNSLVFQIDRVISISKNGETKTCKTVQELKSLVKQNHGKDRSSDRHQITKQPELVDRKYFGGGKKMKEDLDFFFHNNASQAKKESTKKIKPCNTSRIKLQIF